MSTTRPPSSRSSSPRSFPPSSIRMPTSFEVLMVDTGTGAPVQVVCGAPNARAGLVGAFAASGTYVPGIDVTLSVGNIRGVESHGMMCSEKELEISDDHDGIIDLPEDAPVGHQLCGLCRPRRSDDRDQPDAEPSGLHQRLRHRPRPRRLRPRHAEGAARRRPSRSKARRPVKVTLDLGEDTHLCPGFALRLVRGVKNGPSPEMDAAAAAGDRSSSDQRAGRHHQLHDLRPGPADARLRRRQGHGQPDRAPRQGRRNGAGARPARIQARPEQRRHRR